VKRHDLALKLGQPLKTAGGGCDGQNQLPKGITGFTFTADIEAGHENAASARDQNPGTFRWAGHEFEIS
jgi:hypothetical protein